MAARTKISFGTCNLYNLNLPEMRLYRDADGWSSAQYEAKVGWLSWAIATLDADCWGFQELWHKEALRDVVDRAGLLSRYRLLVPEDQIGQNIVCGGAVRNDLLVGEPEWIAHFPEKMRLESGGDDTQAPNISVRITGFSRPVLHFQIRPKPNEKPIHVYVVHLKSKRPTEVYREGWYRNDTEYYRNHSTGLGYAISTIRRTAEAAALRMVVTDMLKGTDEPVVILGDINDGQHGDTLNTITGQPNYLLSGLSEGGSDVGLYTVATLQGYRSLREVHYTHIHQNQHDTLDHILVSQEFYDNARKRRWAFKGMEVRNDHLNRDDHKSDGTTDHGVVKATFEYRPAG